MKFPIRHPDGRERGPYTIEELEQLRDEQGYPPNTEVFANGEWVSLGGWLVVRKRVEQLQAAEASRPQAAPPPSPAIDPQETRSISGLFGDQKAIFIGAALFVGVILLAIFLR